MPAMRSSLVSPVRVSRPRRTVTDMAEQASISNCAEPSLTLGGWTGQALHTPTPINQGWSCPKCGSAHAPHVQTCPQGYGLSQMTGTYSPPVPDYRVMGGQGTVGFQTLQQNVSSMPMPGYVSTFNAK